MAIQKISSGIFDQATRDILNGMIDELSVIRKMLGAGVGGTGAGALVAVQAAVDPASHANATQELVSVSVTGARPGDFCFAAFTNDQQGIGFHAYCSANDTVKVCIDNNAAGTIDLASGTVNVLVIPQAAAAQALAAMVLTK